MGDESAGNDTKRVHSIKVPQLYKEASRILKKYESNEGSLKYLVNVGKYRNINVIYGLVTKLVDNLATVKNAIAVSGLSIEEPKFDPFLARVLTAQLLSKGSVDGDAKPIVIFKKYQEKIKAAASGKWSSENTRERIHPRYAVVNTLLVSVDDAHTYIGGEGFVLEKYDREVESYDDFLQRVKNLRLGSYVVDYHIPDLLVFHPKLDFWRCGFVKKNIAFLQDKASCLPVFLSSIKEDCNVIDACAAPGNKTMNIVMKMKNKGKVIAVERDSKRFLTMKDLVSSRGANCVEALNMDFRHLQPADHGDVEYIFLDPTCSSSGANFHNDEIAEDRLVRLSAVQVDLLKHAFSFPSVKEVIYSTCSIHEQENERVVDDMLQEFGEEFELVNLGSSLRGWKHFGQPSFSFGHNCVRTNRSVDQCTGFFVTIFRRKDKTECKKRKKEDAGTENKKKKKKDAGTEKKKKKKKAEDSTVA